MIKKETQSQFNSDFEKVLERAKLDPIVSKISNSLISAVRSDFGKFYFVAFIHRDKDESKVLTSYQKNKMSFTPNQNHFDIFSWFPVISGNLLEFFKNKSLAKIIGEDFSKNPLRVEVLEKNRDKVKEFVKSKINSQLLKDQKLRLKCYETGDWSPFLKKFKKGDSYPIDVFPKEKQFELFWSQTELFGDDVNSTLIKKDLTVSSEDNVVYRMVFDNDLSLFPSLKRFENQIDSYALTEFLNPSRKIDSRKRIANYLIKRNQVSENDLIRALDLSIDRFIKDLKELEKPFGENVFLKLIHKFPGLDDLFVKERFMNKLKNYLFSDQYKVRPFFEILPTSAYEEFKSLGLIKEEAFKDFFNFSTCICYSKNKITYSPLFGGLYFLGMDEINDLDNTYKVLEETILSARESIRTSKRVKEEVRFILDSSMLNLPERIIQHLNFVLTMDEWWEIRIKTTKAIA